MALPWKALAKRQRKVFNAAYVNLQQMLARVEDMLERGRSNPGLLLAGLVMEAHKEGLEIGCLASECMGWVFAHYLSNHPEGPNYLEVTLENEGATPIYVTVQRPTGKTPHQMRMEAEAELKKLKPFVDWMADQPCIGNGSGQLCRINSPHDTEWCCNACKAHLIRYGE